MSQRKYLPPVHVRELLAEWPEGEARLDWDPLVGDIHWLTRQRLIAEGWVRKEPHPHAATHSWRYQLVRTAKPAPGYTPRKSDAARKKRGYNGVWPWGFTDHALALRQHPMRLLRQQYNLLAGKPDEFSDLEMQQLTPGTFWWPDAQLRFVRRVLPGVFGHAEGQDTEDWKAWERGTIPEPLAPYLLHGGNLRWLLCLLLVEPEFGADGRLTRFVPMDHDAALRECLTLTGDASTLAKKYHTFMATRAAMPMVRAVA